MISSFSFSLVSAPQLQFLVVQKEESDEVLNNISVHQDTIMIRNSSDSIFQLYLVRCQRLINNHKLHVLWSTDLNRMLYVVLPVHFQ